MKEKEIWSAIVVVMMLVVDEKDIAGTRTLFCVSFVVS